MRIKITLRSVLEKISTALSIVMLISLLFTPALAIDDTTPDTIVYEGRLLDAAGNPVTTTKTMRFSLWKSADWQTSDTTAAGAIDLTAATYGGWFETQNVTPNSSGVFSVKLGAVVALPNINFTDHKFLQVEIKNSGASDTGYELMDVTGDSGVDANDRQTIGSIPYAKNTERIDNHEVGTNAGDVALVGPGGQFTIDQIPAGTNTEIFTLDNDNTVETAGTGAIDLQFGNTLGKMLSYDLDNSYFNFNDNVNVDGDLSITGAITGATIDGTLNTIQNLAWSALTTRNKSISLVPQYPGVVITEDGSANNLATLHIGTDQINNHQYYQLESAQNTLNGLDLYIRFQLPDDFDSWQAIPIQLTLKSISNDSADNQVDVYVSDTLNSNVLLPGTSDLASAVADTWTTKDIIFGGTPTFTPGGYITIHLHPQAKDNKAIYLGELKLDYIGK